MTTLALLTTETLNILYGSGQVERPKEDIIVGTLATGGLTLDPTIDAMWKKNDLAEFQSTGEIVRFAADAAGATTIRRAQLGTTLNPGTYAAGSVIAKLDANASFGQFRIGQLISQVVRSDLWPHVWTWHRDSFTATRTDFQYDLDQYIDEVVLVYQENIDADEKWRPLPPGWWSVERQINTTVAAQGGLLVLHRVFDYDEPVYLTCKRRPDTADLGNLSDVIADMIPWAAAAKSLAARSAQIKNAAARSRQDQEGGLMRDYRGLMSEFIRMRDMQNRVLIGEVEEDKRWKGNNRAFVRSW